MPSPAGSKLHFRICGCQLTCLDLLSSLHSRICRCQPTCLDLLSPAASSMHFRICCRQFTRLDLPSSAASSLYYRIWCCQPAFLDLASPAASSLNSTISRRQPTCVDLPRLAQTCLDLPRLAIQRLQNKDCTKAKFGVHAKVSNTYIEREEKREREISTSSAEADREIGGRGVKKTPRALSSITRSVRALFKNSL